MVASSAGARCTRHTPPTNPLFRIRGLPSMAPTVKICAANLRPSFPRRYCCPFTLSTSFTLSCAVVEADYSTAPSQLPVTSSSPRLANTKYWQWACNALHGAPSQSHPRQRMPADRP